MSAPATPQPRRLYRRRDGRMLGGVAGGLADHLGIEATLVRIGFVIGIVVGGLGGFLYAAFWAVLPLEQEHSPRTAKHPATTWTSRYQLLGFAALGIVMLLLAQVLGFGAGLLWPAAAAAAGAAILWRQADEPQREKWRSATVRRTRVLSSNTGAGTAVRAAFGILLVIIGMATFLAAHGQLPQARRALLPLLVVVIGLLLVIGPWMIQTVRELTDERTARIREQERADLAGRVHDSMLQTLALIQRNANDPVEVQRLVRHSERELRGWLYGSPAPETLRAAMVAVRNAIEDEYSLPVDLVTVGDHPATTAVQALAQATREAAVNAAKHSRAKQIDLYVEVGSTEIVVFVRDRGVGFDLDAVPDDRFGVRESLIARMERNGGQATIRTSPGNGTEVRLSMPIAVEATP